MCTVRKHFDLDKVILLNISVLREEQLLAFAKFYKIYFLLSVISILFFQFIWWKWFYSEISLSRRVTVWNIVTIFFPLIPMLGLLLKHSGKLIK